MRFIKAHLLLVGLALLVYFTSCSKEAEPIFIRGVWNAYYFEQLDCQDSVSNLAIDFKKDSVYNINGQNVRFISYKAYFNRDDYSFVLTKEVDGVLMKDSTTGLYLSSGFNDIVFCLNDCSDTLYNTGIYVVQENNLDLTWQDTFNINCGFLFQAKQ